MITGGVIRYEDGRKAGEEYAPPKKAVAEIHFSVPEGGDEVPIIDKARAYAMSQVTLMLGGGPVKREPGEASPTPRAAAVSMHAVDKQSEPAPKAEAAAPAADPAAMGDGLDIPPALKRTRGPNKKKEEPAPAAAADPAAMADPSAVLDKALAAAAPAASAEPRPDTSDKGMYDFVTKLNAKFDNKAAPKITPIMKDFIPEGGNVSLKSIPEEKRLAFFAKLTEASKTW